MVLSSSDLAAQDDDNVSFTFQQGGFERCVRDSFSIIEIIPNSSLTLSRITLTWITGETEPIILTAPFDLTQSFTYPADRLFEDCDYGNECFPTLGLCFSTRIVAEYEENNTVENITRDITFRKPPELTILGAGGPYCVGQTIDLSTRLCPSNDPTNEAVIWTLPDGSETETEPSFTFPTVGTYDFSVRTMNGCGDDETSVSIEVIDEPRAVAFPDSGLISNAEPYRVCLDGSATIRLNGEMSTGNTSCRWQVSPSISNTNFPDRTSCTSRVTFTQDGLYTFTFIADNDNCGLEDQTTFDVEVRQGIVAILTQQPDVCESIAYSPSPLSNDITYMVDDVTYAAADFPLNLGPGTYAIKAEPTTVDEFCGAQPPARDTFSVLEPATALISTPDTVLCDQEPAFDLAVNVTGGQWRRNGTVFNGTITPGSLAPGTYTITYGDPPCIIEDEITIEILGSGIVTEPDLSLCIDQGEVTFSSTPTNGTYSEAGGNVTPDGRFNPQTAGIGEYTVIYNVAVNGSAVNCGSVDSFLVTVSELEASFIVENCAENNVCFSLPAGFDFDSAIWDFGGEGTASGNAPCFDFPAPGPYDVSVTITRGPCEDTYSQEVIIAPAPAPAFSLVYDQDSCSILDLTIINSSEDGDNLRYDWLINGISFSTSPNPGPLQLEAFGTDSVYVIELRLANDCTEVPFSESVTVLPQPVARLETNRDQYCSGDTIRLSNTSFGAPDNYEWTQDGVVIGNDSFPPVIFYETSSVDTVEICLTVSGKCGTNERCKEVRVLPTDVSAFFNVPGPVCAGDCVPITSGATAGAPVIYLASDGQTFTEANPCITFPAPGVYYLVQQAFGCGSDLYRDSIIVVDSPVADFINPAFGCPGIPLTFTDASSDLVTYEWDFGDGSATATTANSLHAFSGAGTFEVCLTVTSALPDGCDDVRCQQVIINAPPTAGFMISDSVCLGDPTLITSTADVNLLCAYDFQDGNSSNDCDAAHVFLAAGNQVIAQTVTDNQTGCRDTLLLPTFVRPLPNPAFSLMTMDACNPDIVDFMNETPDADSYFWEFGDTGTSVATNPQHTYSAAGTYTVRLTAFTDGICPATVEREVTINEMPVADIEAEEQEICLGEEVNLSSSSSGLITEVRWDFGDGQVGFTPEISHEYLSAGIYTVTLTVFNGTLCSDSTTLLVTVNEPVIAAFTEQTDILCFGAMTGSLSVATSSGASPFGYAWSNGPTVPENPGLTAGDYAVTITDANLCTTELSTTLTQPDRIDALATVTRVTCSGGSDGTVSVAATGGVPPYELQWPGGDATEIITDLTAGAYAVTIVDDNECSVIREVVVPENPPLAFQDSLEQISCFGAFDGAYGLRSVSGGVPPYRLTLTGAGYEQTGIGISRFDSLGPGFYTFEVLDSVGCFVEKEIEIVEPDEVTIDVLEDSIFLRLGQSLPLDTRFNANDPVFEWTPPRGLDCTDCPVPLAGPFTDVIYVVNITDNRGCSAADTVVIDVEINRDIFIPTGFTPNIDGRNDLLRVRTKFPEGILSVVYFRVFDRWDGLLFEQLDFPPNEEAFGWDGTKNGEPVELGAYYYELKVQFIDEETKTVRGVVNIIR